MTMVKGFEGVSENELMEMSGAYDLNGLVETTVVGFFGGMAAGYVLGKNATPVGAVIAAAGGAVGVAALAGGAYAAAWGATDLVTSAVNNVKKALSGGGS